MRILKRLFMFAVAVGSLIGSGFEPILGEQAETIGHYGQSVLFTDTGIAIRSGMSWYGFRLGESFESPLFAWVLFMAGLVCLGMTFASKNYWDTHIDRKRQ